ncbi:hemolysin D [Burkholderia vietnamiensis]|uniref:HlyD family secretion protein n=1 Tax=Burkholderia cepacia complex TaxID=87882 RepID=UPI000761EC2B|nr:MULTISPECIES: HlyD family efflux transporter periplasmic adaptor subunit [Burkholderia cepacia complex]KVS41297.1 hemolysin D [Burkholderia vietnamiensis]MBU9640067.1 HlyD family efflux transporter periplasmic adaptor subunit [Burkholderia multivorans]PRE94857.1 EmrA/EmrK family multidrug efflux transporter periplasmic adaptor subunit [Burkholderia multivorans]PRG41483.1 EmrA/EmrK family multidrug efflux transporter periplasmic adaptor subunit [Burkholderia multivorans]
MSTEHDETQGQPTPPADPVKKEKRKKMLLAFGGVLVLIAVCYGVWLIFFAGKTVTTDDAYTAVEVADVTPLVSGPVKEVKVVNTQAVHAGDVLVVLDDTDAKIAVDQAEAELGRARRQVRQIMANDTALAGQFDLREAQIASAERDVARARAAYDKAVLDEKRRRNLVNGGAVSAQDFTNAQAALREATAALGQAEANLKAARAASVSAHGSQQANQALFLDSTIETNPIVVAAKARLDKARVDLDRTIIRAPVDGIVSQRAVDIGQHVQAGTRLMNIVPIQQIYVDANFKENQLRNVRPGQKAKLTSDLYGDDVEYDGWVEGFEGGSGSALSVIPAQNATGNWIKVVQRLPVRIHLDPEQLKKHPLRIGLSMEATVDVTTSGAHQEHAKNAQE